jgi:hypothetical protein
LDDLVVDVGEFMDSHPGGKFSLQHNVGQDISKFFYGAYSLESMVAPVTHSSLARKMVNRMVVARLVDNSKTKIMRIREIERSANQSGTTKSIIWEDVEPDSEQGLAD